jgi:hypothetical protein
MKVGKFYMGLAAAGLSVMAGVAEAAPVVTISTSNAGAASTGGLAAFTTTGAQMTGMRVTGFFADQTSQALSWAATGANAGGVNGLFSVSLSGNTFTADWVVTTSQTLTGLLFEGQPGDTIFDRTNPFGGTAGSEQGADFEYRGNDLGGTIDVTYSRPLSLNSDPAVGDLWVNMLVDLGGLKGGGLLDNQTLRYRQDTDNVALPGDISPIPLPGALPLLGSALAGIGLLRRRRQNAA